VAGKLVKKDVHPHRDAQQSLGNELRSWRGSERSGTVRAGARPAVASSPDQPTIRPHLDLDLFGILGVAGGQSCTALRANTLILGQLEEILDDRQMAVIPSCWTRPILPLASLGRCGTLLIVIFAFEVIRAIPGRRFLALSTEELILEPAILTAKLFNLGFELILEITILTAKSFDLGFKVLGPMHGPSVLSLPISDLLPQLEILSPQMGDFLSQLGNFAPKLPDQLGKISRRRGRMWADERVFHDNDACNPSLASKKRSTSLLKRVRRSFTTKLPSSNSVFFR
jgi:hypothetical protein